jgi:hypothetical protein
MGFGAFRKYKKGQRKLLMSFKDSDKNIEQSATARLAHERSLNQTFGLPQIEIPQHIFGRNGHGIRRLGL